MGKRKDPSEWSPEYAKYRETKLAASRSWNRRHKWVRMFRVYGIGEAVFEAIFARQGGKCAICGIELTSPHVDHDHKTNHVRGLLCGPCNQALGLLRDDPLLLEKAASYLRNVMPLPEVPNHAPDLHRGTRKDD
jgi:hypothetical protein